MEKKLLFNSEGTPVEPFKAIIEALFKPGDTVGYVTDGTGGVTCHRTAGELAESAEKYPDDLGATIGDWNPDTGAQIMINPLDGHGAKTENVTRYPYALVRTTAIPVFDQFVKYHELKLPIVALVKVGDKYLDAIIRVDAGNLEEYKERVAFLQDFLDKKGCCVNRNLNLPTCLATLPGANVKDVVPSLVETNIGCSSWDEWEEFAEATSDDLPGFETLDQYVDNPPILPGELIQGVLRKGHKMIIAGPSKAGKSFLLMELGAAIAEGGSWLGFKCSKGRVLYVNLEIDSSSAVNRILNIYNSLGIPLNNTGNLVLWNLRGHAMLLDKLVPKLLCKIKDQHFDAVIIDPIYKVITGDENSATDMGYFSNQLDKICAESGCSVIYCHHHSKGAQSYKKSANRASGSGVFSRDPDAILDISELELSAELKDSLDDINTTAWRMEFTLREFPVPEPVNFWFNHPTHCLDTAGELEDMPNLGTAAAGRLKNSHSKSTDEANSAFRNAFDACNIDGAASVQDMCQHLGYSNKTIYARIKKMSDEFTLANGKIFLSIPADTSADA